MGDRDRYIHLKEIFVEFIKRRPKSVLELVLKDDAGIVCKSNQFKEHNITIHWNLDTYVRAHTSATLTIQQALIKISVAQIEIEFKPNEFGDYRAVGLQDSNHRVAVNFVCGRSKSLADVTRALGSQARTDASMVPRFLKLPQVAALPLTSKRGYNARHPAIHRLNNDILLGIFDWYRLDDQYYWNDRLRWCKLSHVCQSWRHLIHECASYLGLHIKCTNGTPTVDTLDHLPPLPLFVDYGSIWDIFPFTVRDESGIYHALRLRDRVCHIGLRLPPSILHKVVVLLDGNFPILEHLSLQSSATTKNSLPLTLPKAFLAPNLRHLALPGFSPPRRLRLLTSTVSLVRLELIEIQTSSYFRPRLLVARLRSLPQLQELDIDFSTPIPRPSTERKLLGEQGAPVTLPSLESLKFKGVGAYLESLVAQIRAPLLDRLEITLFNQIAFAFPHLLHLINTTEGFRFPGADVYFDRRNLRENVFISTNHLSSARYLGRIHLFVICEPLDWQIDCASQICHALIPALSGVERCRLICSPKVTPTEWQNWEIDGTTWHDLLRSFIGMKELYIDETLLEELSRALQVDEVGSDPGFLPNLQSIRARQNLFTSFIDTRQVAGRPVQFVLGYP